MFRANQSESEQFRGTKCNQRFSEIFQRFFNAEKKKPCTTISIEIFDLHWKWNSVIRIAHLEGTEGKRDACFLDLYMFFGPNQIFLDLGSQKMWGACLCVFWTLWGYFFGPACICAGPREIFFDSLIVSELGSCFLDPCTCFLDLASIGWGGETPLL